MEESNLCPDNCEFLDPTEEQQDKTKKLGYHFCKKYKRYIYHGVFHPRIMRTESCIAEEVPTAIEEGDKVKGKTLLLNFPVYIADVGDLANIISHYEAIPILIDGIRRISEGIATPSKVLYDWDQARTNKRLKNINLIFKEEK